MTSIITQIWNGAVKDFDAAEAWINQQVQRIEAVFPASTATINAIGSDIKQAASDAIGMADSALNNVAPGVTTAIEAAADGALTHYTGGLAIPLVPLTNDGISQIESLIVSTANAWALKAKAALAENNTTTGAAAPPAAS